MLFHDPLSEHETIDSDTLYLPGNETTKYNHECDRINGRIISKGFGETGSIVPRTVAVVEDSVKLITPKNRIRLKRRLDNGCIQQ